MDFKLLIPSLKALSTIVSIPSQSLMFIEMVLVFSPCISHCFKYFFYLEFLGLLSKWVV